MRRLASQPFSHFPHEWHLSPIVEAEDYVFFSGVTGYHPDGRVDEDPARQFRDAFGFVQANLAEVGLGWPNVVELITYHVDLRRHFDAFVRVKDEFVPAPYPAWTAIGVCELISPGTLLEIRVIAKRPWPPEADRTRSLRPDELNAENDI